VFRDVTDKVAFMLRGEGGTWEFLMWIGSRGHLTLVPVIER